MVHIPSTPAYSRILPPLEIQRSFRICHSYQIQLGKFLSSLPQRFQKEGKKEVKVFDLGVFPEMSFAPSSGFFTKYP